MILPPPHRERDNRVNWRYMVIDGRRGKPRFTNSIYYFPLRQTLEKGRRRLKPLLTTLGYAWIIAHHLAEEITTMGGV